MHRPAAAAPPDGDAGASRTPRAGTACAYVRVSTAREDMISPEIQRDSIARYAVQSGLVLAETVQDLDLSGRSVVKRSIGAIVDRVEAGLLEVIIVYNFARFGRNTREALVNIARVEAAGGQVVSATEPVDPDTAIGRYSRTNLLALAEMQSDMIGDGWRSAMDHRVRRGLPGSGRPRYGYVYHRAAVAAGRLCPQGCGPGDCRTGYAVDPATGPVLARMYRRYVAGDGLGKIAHWLNESRVPTPRGRAWTPGTVSEKLDSGFGAGLVLALGQLHPGAHVAVILPEEWQAYRERRASLAPVAPRSRDLRWDLAGLARCGRCGGPMTASSQGRDGSLYLLRCNAERLSGKAVCQGGGIKRATAEAAVLAWLARYADPIEAAARKALEDEPPSPAVPDGHGERLRLEKSIRDRRRGIERLADAVAQGMPVDEYVAARTRWQTDLDRDLAELAAQDAEVPAAPPPTRVATLLGTWPELTVRARRDVLGLLIQAVLIHPAGRGPDRVEVVPRPGL